jgi:hypothetical protein
MFVTNKFVFIHVPKTGGTFVNAMLTKLHQLNGFKFEKILMDSATGSSSKPIPDPESGVSFFLFFEKEHQHGRRSNIPPAYRDLPILCNIRNPFDRYVSQYLFPFWKNRPHSVESRYDGGREEILKRFPSYPDLTFEEFVYLSNSYNTHVRCPDPAKNPGFHTHQLVDYIFSKPETIRSVLCDSEVALSRIKSSSEFKNTVFLDQTNLNQNLHRFLCEMGYAKPEIDFVLNSGKILPPTSKRPADNKWETYYTPELKSWIRQREELIFRLFPQFDIGE